MPAEWDDDTPGPGDMVSESGHVIRCPYPAATCPDWVTPPPPPPPGSLILGQTDGCNGQRATVADRL